VAGLDGATITATARRGKYLLCDLDTGDRMMIHLRMSGRVLVVPAGAPRPLHTHVVLSLAPRDGAAEDLLFVDPRTFGEVVVYDPDNEAAVLPELGRLGVDPIAEPFDGTVLRDAPRRPRSASWRGSATSTPTRSCTVAA
jgi:formamidopyrimidine-DNA glycosylase